MSDWTGWVCPGDCIAILGDWQNGANEHMAEVSEGLVTAADVGVRSVMRFCVTQYFEEPAQKG